MFVDGCFWHGCPIHGTIPESNRDYWLPKLERNRQRGKEMTAELEAEGWTVIWVWEHDLKKMATSIDRIKAEIEKR